MRDSAIVTNSFYADNRDILHGDGQESGEDPLHRCAFVLKPLEGLASVIDLLANAWGQADQDVAPFLGEELRMVGRTQQITLPLSSEMNGTAILEVSHPRVLESHFSLAAHGKIGLTVNVVSVEGVGGCFF